MAGLVMGTCNAGAQLPKEFAALENQMLSAVGGNVLKTKHTGICKRDQALLPAGVPGGALGPAVSILHPSVPRLSPGPRCKRRAESPVPTAQRKSK